MISSNRIATARTKRRAVCGRRSRGWSSDGRWTVAALFLSFTGFVASRAQDRAPFTGIPTSGYVVPSPPGQPDSGPGGKDYLYLSVRKLGPYYANPADPQPYSSFFIFQPEETTLPSSLPVVLFLHGYFLHREGYPAGDSPAIYLSWIEHLVRKGYTVVFPSYDYKLRPAQFGPSIVDAWRAALSLLQTRSSGLIPPASDAQGLRTIFAGHSLGAYECFSVAYKLTVSPTAGVPLPRAIAAFEPSTGSSGLPADFSRISPAISVVIVQGDQDANIRPTVQAIWNSIGRSIPSARRDFLELISDVHGVPAQIANHWYPDTDGSGDNGAGVDNRDYNVTWKLSVGLFDCVLNGKNCAYGLGHGSAEETGMGRWSDGTPVKPLVLIR